MLPVEIQAIQGTLILRARGSELLITPNHVATLRGLKQPSDFTKYFLNDALINRPARKLFEAWLRKDSSLWQRLYNKVQKELQDSDIVTDSEEAPKPAKAAAAKETKEKPAAKKAEAKPAAEDKKAAAKKVATKKEVEEKKPAAPAKKVAAKKEEKPAAKKPATKSAAKPAAPAKKAAAAPAKKKTAAKATSKSTSKKK